VRFFIRKYDGLVAESMLIDRFENILQFSDKGNERIAKYPINAINDMIIVGDQFDNPLGICIDENHNRKCPYDCDINNHRIQRENI
jgi:chromosome condensin MukBEF complex kleisin-like MukF subunit